MGLKDLLFGKKEKGEPQSRSDKVVARYEKKLMNKYHQTLERKRIVRLLADIGTEEAITAMLGRFTYVTDGSIVDEDEKTLTYEVLLGLGDRALSALTEFVSTQVAIYWPLKALTELAGEDYAVDVLLKAIDSIHDRFEKSAERLNNLVSSLRDFQSPKVLAKLIELSHDDSEEIRFLAVDGLSTFDEHQEAVDAIVERLIDEEETTRVKTFIMDLLMERKWKVKKYKKDLTGKIPDTYFVDDTGVIQRRY